MNCYPVPTYAIGNLGGGYWKVAAIREGPSGFLWEVDESLIIALLLYESKELSTIGTGRDNELDW